NSSSDTDTSNLAKLLAEQFRILFLQTRVPTKRTPKLQQLFENFHSTYNDEIAKLASQLIQKKDNQVEVNVLKTFVVKSLQIHVKYLIVESNGESPNYTLMVLNCIKELDNITINFTFPAT
ncbi:9906_t:CDS:2, partial [Scutellospora calospora]